MANFAIRARRALVELNLFKSGLSEVGIIQQERWSTRFYIILLIAVLLVLVIYTAFGTDTVHVIVENPSLETFETLQEKYAATLKCPCSQIAVEYGSFVQMQPIYHPVRKEY